MTTPKEWNDDEVKAEIRECVGIVREDRFEKFLREKLANQTPPAGSNGQPPPSGGTNPDPAGGQQKAKKSLFWGETE